MCAHVSQGSLREAVFKACTNLDAFESMPFSTIRKETERILGLEKKALKDRKDDVANCIFQFRNVHKFKKGKNSEEGGDVVKKKGKYSVHETELILSAVNDYVEANDLLISDVCSEMRGKSEKYHRHSALWDNLQDLLPHRERVSIYEHAKRKLMSDTRTGTFSEEEKKKVIQMVNVYGHDWKRIAHELGRMTGDVKDLHKIISAPRKNSGHFTLQEAARLIVAVKHVTGTPNDVEAFAIPFDNISWKAVARLLADERLPLDYLRHWKVVRRTSWLGHELVNGMVTTSQQYDDDRKIVAYIAEMEPEDISEVTWSAVDSALLTRQKSFDRWKSLCSENLLNFRLDFAGSLSFLKKKFDIMEGGVMNPETDRGRGVVDITSSVVVKDEKKDESDEERNQISQVPGIENKREKTSKRVRSPEESTENISRSKKHKKKHHKKKKHSSRK